MMKVETCTASLLLLLAMIATVPAAAERPASYAAALEVGTLLQDGPGSFAWADDASGFWHQSADRLQLLDSADGAVQVDIDFAGLQRSMAEQFGPMARLPLALETLRVVDADTVQMTWAEASVNIETATGDVSLAGSVEPIPPGRFIRNRFLFDGVPVPDLVSPQGQKIASVRDGNVVVRASGSNEWQALTDDATERHGWDLASGKVNLPHIRAARTNAWSESGAFLFAMKIDRTAMDRFPALKIVTDDLPEVVEHDHFRPGGPYYRYQPAVLDVEAGKPRFIHGVDVADEHVVFLQWDDRSDTVWFAGINRDFSRIRIMRADAATGAAEVVYTEAGGRGLLPPHQVYYVESVGFALLPNDRGFIFESERSGWKHLYHYDFEGQLVGQLTNGEFPVANFERFDTNTDRVYFMARSDADRPYDIHLHSVSLDGSAARQHTVEAGVHTVSFSPDGSQFADRYSSPATPPTLALREVDGDSRVSIAETNIDALRALGWSPPVEFVSTAAAGGMPVYGTLYRPFDFDPERKYPVIEEIYGGQFVIKGDHEFLAAPFKGGNYPLALAQLGYVVVRFDTPGTIGRSRAFAEAVNTRWGPGLIADHAAVIRDLGEQYDYVDSSRVGIFGHSWGGYYALMALALEGDTYDAAISTAPGVFHDIEQADAFMEAHLGSPADNPEAWERVNFFNYVDNIENPLLLGVGNRDYGLYAQVIRVSDALIKRGFLHEVMLAPTMAHGIYGPYEEYFIEKSTRFFLQHVPVHDEPQDEP